jgi:hypothetical protein
MGQASTDQSLYLMAQQLASRRMSYENGMALASR